MKEHGIIFTGWSVQRILARAKTQTRRIIKPQPPDWWTAPRWPPHECNSIVTTHHTGETYELRCPWGNVGDVLYVREAVATNGPWNCPEECNLWYPADGTPRPAGYQLRTGRFAPKWTSRLRLLVTDVRAQRVQDISEDDAIAEGCEHCCNGADCGCRGVAAIGQFINVWDGIYTKPDQIWSANPWVLPRTYEVME